MGLASKIAAANAGGGAPAGGASAQAYPAAPSGAGEGRLPTKSKSCMRVPRVRSPLLDLRYASFLPAPSICNSVWRFQGVTQHPQSLLVTPSRASKASRAMARHQTSNRASKVSRVTGRRRTSRASKVSRVTVSHLVSSEALALRLAKPVRLADTLGRSKDRSRAMASRAATTVLRPSRARTALRPSLLGKPTLHRRCAPQCSRSCRAQSAWDSLETAPNLVQSVEPFKGINIALLRSIYMPEPSAAHHHCCYLRRVRRPAAAATTPTCSRA